jgi:hypothetical protein
MLFDIALVVFGLVIVIAMMVFVFNPPEAWIKRYFHRK